MPIIDGDVVRIPLTKGKIAIVDLIDADLGQFNWTARKGRNTWYAYRNSPRPNAHIKIRLHRVVAERAGLKIDGLEVDHRDTDGLNCRRENLRAATRAQNGHNSRRSSSNTSGFKGVSFDRRSGSYYAQICLNRKRSTVGGFKDPRAAADAYAEMAKRLHGEFARA